jgi:transcriptional regulator with XRE-family HTH domain
MLSADSRGYAQEESLAERLESWRGSCRDRFDTLVQEALAAEQPSRYVHGVWTFTYVIDGLPVAANLSELLELLDKVRGHETGWAPWWVPTRDGIKPYTKDGLIECWLAEPNAEDAKDPGHSDFWLASPSGKLCLLRGYQEDGEDGEAKRVSPGTVLDVRLPIWRVGECLLHARRLASTVEDDADVAVGVTWEGLKGRQLVSWARPRRLFFDTRTCKEENSVESLVTTKASEIRAMLPDLVRQLTAPLYEAFDFFSPHDGMIEAELERMVKGRV